MVSPPHNDADISSMSVRSCSWLTLASPASFENKISSCTLCVAHGRTVVSESIPPSASFEHFENCTTLVLTLTRHVMRCDVI